MFYGILINESEVGSRKSEVRSLNSDFILRSSDFGLPAKLFKQR